MSKNFQAHRLDVAAAAQQKATLSGQVALQDLARLAQEALALSPDLSVDWRVQGESRTAVDGSLRPALHLQASTVLPLTCQRCMGEMRQALAVDRHFIFVPDEEMAGVLDDASEDDVLVLAPDFDLLALIEDELLMALPLVPRHERCPEPVRLSVQDAGFEAAQEHVPHPFAALAALKDGKPH